MGEEMSNFLVEKLENLPKLISKEVSNCMSNILHIYSQVFGL